MAFVGGFATYGIWQEWWLGTLSFSLFLVLVMARVAGRAGLPAIASASNALSFARRRRVTKQSRFTK
jgi:hypothetical protein